MTVETGVQRLLAQPDLIPGSRWGLVTNYTAVLPDFELSTVALARKTGRVAAILGPEHGIRGTAQAGAADTTAVDPDTGLPVIDTYRMSGEQLDAAIALHDLDAVVADIQDIGVRFYTYAWTVVDCMRSAARLGIPFYVLDRPNPLSGAVVEGPGVAQVYKSFVGRADVAVRHGMTLGELACEVAAQDRDVPVPTVVKMDGWRPDMYWGQTGLPWVMPSPNLPTPDTNLVFPGTALFEGTNMSEGRGTTRPFELVGAPWLDDGFARRLNALDLPGVLFRAAWFTPTFSKHEGATVSGVQVHVTDRAEFRPVLTGVAMLATAMELGEGKFQWRMPAWEEPDRAPFVDLLWGSDVLRLGLDRGRSPEQILADSPVPAPRLTPALY